MKITRRQLRQIIVEVISENIDIRGTPVNWDEEVDGEEALSIDGILYTLTGPLNVPVSIDDMEYESDPESLEISATADLPWPAKDKKVVDKIRPHKIDKIMQGVEGGGDFIVTGKNTIKFNRQT